MNKKANIFGTIVIIILVLVILFFVALYFNILTKDRVNQAINNVRIKVLGLSNQTNINFYPEALNNEIDWCQKQNINTGDDLNTPQTISILGYDQENTCCAKEYAGYTCDTKIITKLIICKDADIGGNIIWFKYDGKYLDNNLALPYVKSLKKDLSVC